MRTRIRFILNPFSGLKKKSLLPALLSEMLDKERFDFDICFTKATGHAAELAREAREENYEAVVVVGGDGTINEVGTQLIGSSVALGIIPGGSGNGIARSFGIHMDTRHAIKRIASFEKVLIDTGVLAERPFIGIAGIGFDAHIGDRFLHRKIRGKLAYGYVMMKEFPRFDSFSYSVDGGELRKEVFVLAFANTSQYGNNAVIAPLAEFQDGKLEMVCISDMNARKVPEMMMRLFNRTIDRSTSVQTMQFEELRITHSSEIGHVDGEPFKIGSDITVKIVPESLWVLR